MDRPVVHHDGAERFNQVVRIVILIVSSAVMLAGLSVAVGLVHLKSIPDQLRWVFGTVVFLYGLYRFVIAYVRVTARR